MKTNPRNLDPPRKQYQPILQICVFFPKSESTRLHSKRNKNKRGTRRSMRKRRGIKNKQKAKKERGGGEAQ